MEVDSEKKQQSLKEKDLFKAAEEGDTATFQALSAETLSKALSLRNEDARSLLHVAASFGHSQIGSTPLHRAASTGKSDMCELLIEEGAEVDIADRIGQTPLMNAVICHNKEVALLLIRHGADVDVEDKEGYTVLGRATDELRPILIDAAKAMLE
ncbi:hypothetical protein V8G54_014384 [Vigna mungo]|uniref:Uncharacterized protein n=1 Tax=Vigna mungo TaxID=3915 RepID=A0AAQ3NGK3_VIGMU